MIRRCLYMKMHGRSSAVIPRLGSTVKASAVEVLYFISILRHFFFSGKEEEERHTLFLYMAEDLFQMQTGLPIQSVIWFIDNEQLRMVDNLPTDEDLSKFTGGILPAAPVNNLFKLQDSQVFFNLRRFYPQVPLIVGKPHEADTAGTVIGLSVAEPGCVHPPFPSKDLLLLLEGEITDPISVVHHLSGARPSPACYNLG